MLYLVRNIQTQQKIYNFIKVLRPSRLSFARSARYVRMPLLFEINNTRKKLDEINSFFFAFSHGSDTASEKKCIISFGGDICERHAPRNLAGF
jgi:hypothetical protein